MKMLKIFYLLVGALVCCGNMFGAQIEEKVRGIIEEGRSEEQIGQEMQRVITSAHTAVFSLENLLKKRLKDEHTWYELLNGLEYYVGKKAHNNEKLHGALEACIVVSYELIETIKDVHNLVFSTRSSSSADISRARGRIMQLSGRNTDLRNWHDKLKKTRFYTFSGAKDAVREVLFSLILTLQVTTDKVERDFEKLLP